MTTILSGLIYTLFTICFVYYFKWQKVDDDGGASGKWHKWGMFMRILAALAIISEHFYKSNLYIFATICCAAELIYEIGINIIALHKKALYNGSTSAIDIKFGTYKWIAYFGSLAITATLAIFKLTKHEQKTIN